MYVVHVVIKASLKLSLAVRGQQNYIRHVCLGGYPKPYVTYRKSAIFSAPA